MDTLRGTATQTYSFDLVGAGGATNAIALGNLGVFLAGAVGSIAGGVAIERLGVAAPFILSATMAAVAAVCLVAGGARARRERPAPHLVPSFSRSMTLITRNRRVALIALIVVLAEVLGFSSITVYPTFARDVLGSDAAGLGALATARQIGAIAGLLALARLGLGKTRGGRMIIVALLAFGLGLTAFAASTSFVLSLAVLVVVGAAMAGVDTLSQTLVQRNVDDAERGSAMGSGSSRSGSVRSALSDSARPRARSGRPPPSPSAASSSHRSRSGSHASGRSTSSSRPLEHAQRAQRDPPARLALAVLQLDRHRAFMDDPAATSSQSMTVTSRLRSPPARCCG